MNTDVGSCLRFSKYVSKYVRVNIRVSNLVIKYIITDVIIIHVLITIGWFSSKSCFCIDWGWIIFKDKRRNNFSIPINNGSDYRLGTL